MIDWKGNPNLETRPLPSCLLELPVVFLPPLQFTLPLLRSFVAAILPTRRRY